MHSPPCTHVTPSLDDIVQRVTQQRGDASASSSSPPEAATAAVHAVLSQLPDPAGPHAAELAQTPTVQAVRKLCHAFVERYRTPDALLLDTAWWASEAARLRGTGPSNAAAPPRLLPSPTPTAAEREELLLCTAQLVRATHQSATPADLYSNSCSGGANGGTRQRKTAVAALSSTGSALTRSLPHEEGGETNVLRFDEPTPLRSPRESNWESLELPGGAELQRSGELPGRVRKEEACLHVLDAWVEEEGGAASADVRHDEGGATASKSAEASRVESLACVLHRRPEFVTRHAELSTLLRLVACSTCRNPTEQWTATALALFSALPPRPQLDFMHQLLAALRCERPCAREGQLDAPLLLFVQHLLRDLPEYWLSLLDSEVTHLFIDVLSSVVLPFAAVLEVVDPAAAWLAQWCTRPSFALAVNSLIAEHPGVLRDLCAKLKSSSHTLCVLLHVLPYWSRHAQDGVDGTFLHEDGKAVATHEEKPAQEPPWLTLFRDLQQLLCVAPANLIAAVYELGSVSLCTCVLRLPASVKASCAADLVEALLRCSARGCSEGAELASTTGADVGAAAQAGSLLFAFQLLVELLCGAGSAVTWCPASVWNALDGPVRAQMCAATAEDGDRSTGEDVQGRDGSPREAKLSIFTGEVTTALQRCWSNLLCCHACHLPQSLAALVREVVMVPAADVSSQIPRLLTWHTLIAVSSTLQGWSALQPHLTQLSSHLGGASSCCSVSASTRQCRSLLHAILAFDDCATPHFAAAASPSALPSARTPPPPLKPSEPESPRDSQYAHVDFFSPRCVALFLRWCTNAELRTGLVSAAHEASAYFLGCIQRPDAQDGRGNHTRHDSADGTGEASSPDEWPLLWPVEAYPRTGSTDLSYTESTAASTRHMRSLACYQSLALLLACTALPPLCDGAGDGDGDDTLDRVWRQLDDLWLRPAQLFLEKGDSAGELALPPAPPPASRLRNYPPFEEESLLALLCALALCILVRPSAEYRAWLWPGAVQQRLRPLRRLCVARRGVDPCYFMVRYITSGKGRKRLPAILLDGFAADLTVDTVIDVSDFTEGEDLPTGKAASAVSDSAVQELLQAAFPAAESSDVFTVKSLSVSNMENSSVNNSSVHGKTSVAGAQRPWSPGLRRLARTLLAHQAVLKTTPVALRQLLASRSAEEWERFVRHDERALAVSAVLEVDYPAAAAVLRGGHVDVVYLASLCVSCWLQLPGTHVTSARRKLAWAALQYFIHHGVTAYDGFVAGSLAAHVERLQCDSAMAVNEAVIFPQSRALPLPSSLFVLLLVKPFTLATC